MKHYTFKQLEDPKVRIEIYKQAVKDWRTPWSFIRNDRLGNTHTGFCYYFMQYFKSTTKATCLLSFELEKLRTTGEYFNLFWFTETGDTRKGRRARRKALRKAIQICKQKIKSNE